MCVYTDSNTRERVPREMAERRRTESRQEASSEREREKGSSSKESGMIPRGSEFSAGQATSLPDFFRHLPHRALTYAHEILPCNEHAHAHARTRASSVAELVHIRARMGTIWVLSPHLSFSTRSFFCNLSIARAYNIDRI